jgi:hypothetical protein
MEIVEGAILRRWDEAVARAVSIRQSADREALGARVVECRSFAASEPLNDVTTNRRSDWAS